MDDAFKKQLTQILFSARMLQLMANVFAVFGAFLFGFIYLTVYQDKPDVALRDPLIVGTILLPFLPAVLLARQASKKRKQVRSLIEENIEKIQS